MDLQAELNPKLWQSVSRTYESGLHKNAILNAIHHLTDVLREKADLTGDGAQLVNQAVGGQAPKLQINRLQTPSEKDEQEGFKLMLLGIYQGIRNPRSHEQIEDSKSTADAIIVFINYILGLIDKAKPSFTIEEWSKLVFDDHFVSSREYVDMLVSEVPAGKRFETLIRLFEMRDGGRGDNLRLVVAALIKLLDNTQQDEFVAVVSQELRSVSSDDDIRCVLQLLPTHLWPHINRIARVRIENWLIVSITSGSYDEEFDICSEGALGTCAHDFVQHFDPYHKERLSSIILNKLLGERDEIAYIAKYFFWSLPQILSGESPSDLTKEMYISAICQATHSHPELSTLKGRLASRSLFKFEWSTSIQTALREQNPELYEELFSGDDIPF